MGMLKTYSKKGSYILLDLPYDGKAMPGQFFTLKTETGPAIPRPFSVYDLKDGILTFLINSKGKFESFLECGNVMVEGPFGNPMPRLDDPLLIAGGVGYAPIHFYASKYGFSELVVGAPDDELFDFVDIPDHSICVVEPSNPFDAARFFPLENIILCGPKGMIKASQNAFKNKSLYLVLEEKMACARGMCEGCAVMTKNGVKFVCKDGPTFKATEVDLEWAYL